MRFQASISLLMAAPAAFGIAGVAARADERHFTYSYEAKTLPEDGREFEQWVTLAARKQAGVFRTFRFREEIERGLTDDVTTALYVNWEAEAIRGVPGVENEHEVEFETVSNEWKWKLSDPAADPVGSLLYGEVAVGPDEQELETRVVFSKLLGGINLAYNAVAEAEREKEDGDWAWEYVLSQSAGLSVEVASGFRLGVEGVQHSDFETFLSEHEHNAYFVGPNVHVTTGDGWATLTLLKQVDLQDHAGLVLDAHEKFEVRLIVGVSF